MVGSDAILSISLSDMAGGGPNGGAKAAKPSKSSTSFAGRRIGCKAQRAMSEKVKFRDGCLRLFDSSTAVHV